jgi:hypothetical protein
MRVRPNPAPPARNTSPMGNNNQLVSQKMMPPPPHYPSAMTNYNFEMNAHPNPAFSARNTSSDGNNHYFIPTPQNQTFSPHNVPLTVANHNYDSNKFFQLATLLIIPPHPNILHFHHPIITCLSKTIISNQTPTQIQFSQLVTPRMLKITIFSFLIPNF